MIVRATPLLAQLSEGIYKATLERIEPQSGLYGDFIKWHFLVITPKEELVPVSGLTSTTFTPHPRCKFFAFASAIRGKAFQDNEVLNTDELLNKPCRAYLVIRELETGGSINNVERVLPAEQAAIPSNPLASELTDDDCPF